MARRQFQRSRTSRPNRGWAASMATTTTSIAAGTKVLIGSFGPSAVGVDETVLRTVGGIYVASDQTAASEVQIGAFGMINVTDRASAAGVASIPGPGTDAADDWFLHVSFGAQNYFSSTVGRGPNEGNWYTFDSKAKRILQGVGEELVMIVENLGTVHGFTVIIMLRILAQVRGTG